MARQKCTECDKPSIPGMVKGAGECQYHWDTGAYGKAWADRCALQARIARLEAALRKIADETCDHGPGLCARTVAKEALGDVGIGVYLADTPEHRRREGGE